MSKRADWIKLYRKFIEDPIYRNSTAPQVKVLLAVMCSAVWKEREWDIRGQKITLRPGQAFMTQRRLADICGKDVTRDVVRKSIARFEKMGFWTPKQTPQGTLFTINNWGKYQQDDYTEPPQQTPASPQRAPSETPASPQLDPLNKEGKKVRKKEGKKNTYSPLPAFRKFAGENQPLLDALTGWNDMREQVLKKPLTERAVSLAIKKLRDLSGGDKNTMIDILDQSTMKNWVGLFPLKGNRTKDTKQETKPDRLKLWEETAKKGAWS